MEVVVGRRAGKNRTAWSHVGRHEMPEHIHSAR